MIKIQCLSLSARVVAPCPGSIMSLSAKPTLCVCVPGYLCWGKTNQTSSEVCQWRNILEAIHFINYTELLHIVHVLLAIDLKQCHTVVVLCDSFTSQFSFYPEHRGNTIVRSKTHNFQC